MNKKVFIQSIPRETATLISEWRDPNSGGKLHKTKIGQCRDKISALYSPRVGGLLNGLSYKEWTEGGKPVLDKQGNSQTWQQREEQKWGLAPGYLTNRSWRKGESVKDENLTYYQNKSWPLNDGTTVLDLNNFDDAMFYYVALDSKFIANSEREWKSHKWPNAQFYISLENESEELQHEKNAKKYKAFAKLDSELLTSPKKKEIIWILGLASTFTDLKEEQVDNTLYKFIESDSITNNNIDKFNELYNLLAHEKGRVEFAARLLLKKALDSRVVYEKQDTYTWPRSKGPIVLGEKYSDALEFLLNPKKDSLVLELESEIKAKMF